jgi:uncharacterized protein YfaT (DUF1175 family)
MRGWVSHSFAAFAKGWGRRWVAVLGLLVVIAAVAAFTVHRAMLPTTLLIESLSDPLLADGFSTIQLKVHSFDGRDLKELRVEPEDSHRITAESVVVRGDSALIRLRTGVLPGDATVHLSAQVADHAQIKLMTRLDASDSVGDGTPDFLRLHDASDRTAFRQWFTLLAESQYFGSQPSAEVDDCAALLRYAYREALREHDSAWAKSVSLPAVPAGGGIRQFHYPYTPLGAALFRVKEGSFSVDDLTDGAFAEFADAKTLSRYNAYPLGRDVSRARPGDLLFFRQDGHDFPFHAMIYLGPSQIDSSREPLVVYHTGPMGKSKGEIRRVTVAELANFADPRWRPVPSNPSFLGVYRWNILRGAD